EAPKAEVDGEWALDAALGQSGARVERWLGAEQASASQRAIRQEELLRVAEAMAGLPEAQRRAIELHHLRAMPLSDIADELSTTKAAVAGLLHRGMKVLRSRLGESGTAPGTDYPVQREECVGQAFQPDSAGMSGWKA